LPAPLEVAGPGALVLHLVDEAQPVRSSALNSRVFFTVEAFDPANPDTVVAVASGQPAVQLADVPTRSSYPFAAAAVVPAGWVLRLRLYITGAGTFVTRLLYGGTYDSSLVLSAP
jgi:hypothetical protein